MTETIAGLQSQIKREQTLLVQYEDMERLETDPRRRLKLQENIEEIKQHILTLETRIAQIRAENAPAIALQPRESVFIANVPYGLETALYGRDLELKLLDDWFHHDHDHPLMAVIGLGGQGKSALTWLWQKQLQAGRLAPPLVVWWSFYEADGTMRALLADLLAHFGDDPARFSSPRQMVDRLRQHLQHTPALIVLDGAERLLRAYSSLGAAYQGDDETPDVPAITLERRHLRQCVDPAAGAFLQWLAQPGQTQALTLLTSRLFPEELAGPGGLGLQGVRRHDLTGLNLEAACELFRALGIKTTRAEVRAVCEPLGYHPLSLRLLARTVHYSPTMPDDLQAASAYDPTVDLLGKREHVLRRAYENLPQRTQLTLSRLAAFRSSVAWRVLADVFGGGQAVQSDLQLLEERGLLQRTIRLQDNGLRDTSYDLHPIVRRYAYDRLVDRAAVHGQLVIYFEAVPRPQRVNTLEDLQPAIELYHHLIRAQRYDEACDLFYDRLEHPLYFQLGAYQMRIELLRGLFPDGEAALPRLTKEADQAWTLNSLANSYSLSGQPGRAVPLFEKQIAIREKRGDKKNFAVGLGNLADDQQKIGRLEAAAVNLRRSIALCQEIEDRFNEAIGHREYGRLLAAIGDWQASQAELDTALTQFTEENRLQSQSVGWAYRAQAALWQGQAAEGRHAAQEALRLAEEDARTSYPVERDFVRAYWLLGWAQAELGQFTAAQGHLDEALRRCRAINNVELEPSILLALARLAFAKSRASGQAAEWPGGEAAALAQEALQVAERAGYVLNQADIHNFLAAVALDAGQRDAARQHAQRAQALAAGDGPPYVYKPALDEAERLLKELGAA
jgi:tetratricopeptide (TPR) repeat protein